MTAQRSDSPVADDRIDAEALKPTEVDVARAADLAVSEVVVDFEGHDSLPSFELLAGLARERRIRLTTPVRADGFDPLGDDSLVESLPAGVGRVLGAGNPSYLSPVEGRRPVAERLRVARERDADAWVGTENVERIALTVGGTQFELLSRTTERDVRALRTAGFDGDVALYAPTVLTDDADVVLDAVGEYLARRRPVARALPEGAPTDASASGRAREILLAAVDDYALVGAPATVRERVRALADSGVDRVVAYPARGVDAFVHR